MASSQFAFFPSQELSQSILTQRDDNANCTPESPRAIGYTQDCDPEQLKSADPFKVCGPDRQDDLEDANTLVLDAFGLDWLQDENEDPFSPSAMAEVLREGALENARDEAKGIGPNMNDWTATQTPFLRSSGTAPAAEDTSTSSAPAPKRSGLRSRNVLNQKPTNKSHPGPSQQVEPPGAKVVTGNSQQ